MVVQTKKDTIQNIFFRYYSVLIAIAVLSAVFFFHNYTFRVLSRGAIDFTRRLTDTVSQQLDLEIRKMDTVSLNIVYSNLVRDTFTQYLNGVSDTRSRHKHARTIADIFVAINGPLLPVQQINLYGLDGTMIGTGFVNITTQVPLQSFSWYPKVLALDGRKYLSLPYHQAPFLSETFKNEHFISLYRVYFNNFREKMGIVEVVQNYYVIFGGLKTITDTASKEGVWAIIFNQEGEPIYPPRFHFQSKCQDPKC